MDLLFPGSQLDCRPLVEFLQQSKTEQWRHERIIMDAGNAVCRYKQIQDRECAKFQIEDFLDAAERLMKIIQPIGGTKYMQLHHSISQSIPRGIYAQQPAPLRALETLPVALDILCKSARETLNSLTPSHRPRSPKCILIYELAKAWTDGTSEIAGISGSTTWELPKTPFSNFAKASILMLPSTTEFESGFAELLRRSIKVSEPTK